MSNVLRIIPLGGLGEIGMNCLVLEYKNDMILVDCGIQFPDASYAGVELLTPDLSYIRANLSKLRGVVVTHGHDDHIGAIPILAKETDLDIYCTAFPEGLIRLKAAEFRPKGELRFHRIENRKVFKVGCFSVDPIPVQHSIIEALGLAIQTPVGTVIHSGDFKHDPNELVEGQKITFDPFKEWGDKGVSLLFSDSTNAERLGHTLSELDIARSFEKIFAAQQGRLFIALFASNIRRIEKLLQTAHKQGKKVALGGRSMLSYTKLAHEQGGLTIPPDTLILLEQVDEYPADEVIVLLTGSQAEPQSMLVRISQGTHKEVKIHSGDTVILSSRFIPGNERSITSMIDQLYRLGAEVIYESIHQIHVSGHGFQDELMMLLNAVRPKHFIPVHGEYRHLAKHSQLAKKSGVPAEHVRVIENGQTVEFDGKTLRIAERLELQKGVLVGGMFMDGSRELFTQRLSAAKTGIVFTTLVRDTDSLDLVAPPSVSAFGVLFRKESQVDDILRDASDLAEDIYYEVADSPELHEILRIELRRFFQKHASYKPAVLSHVVDVDR